MTSQSVLHILLPAYSPGDILTENARVLLCGSHDSVRITAKECGYYPKVRPIISGGKEDFVLGKGTAVRFLFHNELASNNAVKADDLVMLIDGTGKIDFGAIASFSRIFQLQPQAAFLFGDRGDHPTWGMTRIRKAVERFENYLILRALEDGKLLEGTPEGLFRIGYQGTREFRDLQCGCWAFRGDYFRLVNKTLTAAHYDLELDIFAAAFRVRKDLMDAGKKVGSGFIQYVPVRIADKTESCTKENAVREMEGLIEAIRAPHGNGGVKDDHVTRTLQCTQLLLEAKQTNFRPGDSFKKLAAIALGLGVSTKAYIDARETWQKHSDLPPQMLEDYWRAANYLFSASPRT